MRHKLIALSIFVFALLLSGAISLGVFSTDETRAQSSGDGLSIVNVNVDSVSGSSASFSGSIEAGFVGCGGGGEGQEEVCFCCAPNEVPAGSFETCDISSASYVIKNSSGATVKNGTVPLASAVNTPTGCVTTCTTDSNNRCDQTRGYNFSVSGLSAGDYTVEVAGNDCTGSNTSSESFTIATPLSGSCSANPNPTDIDESVIWTASASGGTGSYSYSWSGAVTGTGNPKTATYSTTGTKTATVTITSGGQSVQRNCSVEVEDQGGSTNPLSCKASGDTDEFSAVAKGQTKTFNASEGTLTGYTWSSSLGVTPNSGLGTNFNATFNSAKYSTVTVEDSSGATKSCHIDVVDIRANGSDGPININSGDSVNLSWNSGSQTTFCTASGAWSGSKATSGGSNTSYASQTISNITSSGTYSITCGRSAQGTSATDSVTVNVDDAPPPPPPPSTGTINVSSNLSTSWTITGGPGYSGSGTSATYTNAPAGPTVYTISPASKSGYSVSVSPSSSQTLSAGNSITFNIVYSQITYDWTVNCTQDTQTVLVNTPVTVGVQVGGNPPGGRQYFFSAPGGTPSSATTWSSYIQTTYSTTGTKYVTGQYPSNDPSHADTCIVNVVNPKTLTVNKAGAGTGRVYSVPSGINCRTTCNSQSASFPAASTVTLVPQEDPGFTFGGFSGNADCVDGQVTMDVDKACTATFNTATTGTINVSSNLSTSWTITGGPGYSGSGTSATYTNAPAATYTITNIPDIPGYTKTIGPCGTSDSCSQTLSGGGTISFSITYIDSGGGDFSCSPYSQGVITGGTANFSAAGGSGTFSWSAPGGSPSSGGNSQTFASSYSSNGLKTITANRSSDSDQCHVSVSASGNDLPVGTLTTDGGTCRASGWAADPDDRGDAVSVRLYANGVLKQTITANASGAPSSSCPEGNCGYSHVFTDLNPGTNYSIEARAVDAQTGATQSIGTANLTCSANPNFFLTSTNDIKIDTASGTGTSNPTTVRITPLNGFSSDVALSASAQSSELNSKATYIFDDPTLSSGEYSTGSSFRVQLDDPVADGTYPITVTGVGGGFTRTVIVNLLVNAKSPQFIEF